MSYVFDSSSLIYLGKVRLLEVIGNLKGKKFIPKSVYDEVVVEGLRRGDPEAGYIDDLIKRKVYLVKKVEAIHVSIPFLSEADREVIALAKKTSSFCIIDELYGREMAESFGIESHGSIYLIMRLVEQKILTKNEALNYLNRMIDFGFYLSADKYIEVTQKIKNL